MATKATLADFLAAFSCVLVLVSGYFKGNPALAWLPVDLTALACGMVLLGLLVNLTRRGLDFRINPWVLLFIATFLPAWFYGDDNAYTRPKMISMAVALIAMLGSFYLINNKHRIRIWLGLLTLTGALILAGVANRSDDVARLALEGSNTIAAGRASGVALTIVLALLLLTKGAQRLPLAVAAAAFGAATIATGSRGPLFAAALAILTVVMFANIGGRVGRFAAIAVTAVTAWWFIRSTESTGAQRIEAVLSGEQSGTESRNAIWSAALRTIADFPQSVVGVGWSNYIDVLQAGESLASGDRQYAHNVVLEAFVEGGWLPGVAVMLFIVLSLKRLTNNSTTPTAAAVLAVAVFFTVNAMVSGDIGDNRTMWAALAVAWAGWASTPTPTRSALNEYPAPASASTLPPKSASQLA